MHKLFFKKKKKTLIIQFDYFAMNVWIIVYYYKIDFVYRYIRFSQQVYMDFQFQTQGYANGVYCNRNESNNASDKVK